MAGSQTEAESDAVDLDGHDPDETVWVVTNRHTSKPRAYHTDPDCSQLARAHDGVVVDRPASAVVPWRDQCKTCAGTRDLSRSGTPTMGCPFCGADESLPYHLPCEEAPTGTTEPAEGGRKAPIRSLEPDPDPETEPELESRSWICEREGCEEPRGQNLHYCTRACYDIAQRERVEITCDLCDGTKEVIPSREDLQFCTKECANKARRDRVEITCEWCGGTKEVPVGKADQRFCSPACGADYQRFVTPYRCAAGVTLE